MFRPVVEFRPPLARDISYLARHLRQADVDEVRASGYDDTLEAITYSVRSSTHCAMVAINGTPVAVVGLVPINLVAGVAAPWMLGTDAVTRERRALMTYTKPYIRTMLKAYPHLVNYVHAPNTVAVNWLRHIGFSIGPAEPYGPRGELFHRFEMRA